MTEKSDLSLVKKLRSRTSSMMLGETSGTGQDPQANPSKTRFRVPNQLRSDNDIQEAIRAVKDGFRDLFEFTKVPMHVWNDFQPGKKPILKLYRIESTEELFQYAARTLMEVCSGISLQTVGELMNLAFNLRDGGGAYVFANLEPELVDPINSSEIKELCNSPKYPVVKPMFEFIVDDENVDVMMNTANSGCFVAASYLRMLSRNAENYVQIGTNLRNNYLNLFRKQFGLSGFHITLQTAEYIKAVFGSNPIIRNTLYVLLYAGEEARNGKNIKDLLYRNHICHAGLHCYVLFVKVSETYKISTEDLAKVMNSKFYERELNALRSLINDSISTPCNGKGRTMWKYARIFDSNFCSDLQTKKCPSFTATLAWMLKMEDPVENKNVMQITYIRNMAQPAMEDCRKYAKAVRDYIKQRKI